MLKTKKDVSYSGAVRVDSTGRARVDVPVLLRQRSVRDTIENLRSTRKSARAK
jgi:hypothetical protein